MGMGETEQRTPWEAIGLALVVLAAGIASIPGGSLATSAGYLVGAGLVAGAVYHVAKSRREG